MSRERRGGEQQEHELEQQSQLTAGTPGKRTSTQRFPSRQMREPLRPPLLVDREPLQEGQMLASSFLDELHGQVLGVASAELGPISVAGCPYIEEYFAKYRAGSASQLEATLARFAPNTRRARSATEVVPIVVTRIRNGIRSWRDTKRLPADVEELAPGAAAAVAAQPLGQTSLDALQGELGPGQPLDGATATQMSGVIGADVSNARIHTGPEAARRAAEVDAKAFAVGDSVVFGAGAYRPGTLTGDALLAHELAHVAQQSDAARDPVARKRSIGDESSGAEGAADQSLAGALTGKGFGDVLKTGLQLQRCPGGEKLPPGPPMSGKQADKLIATVPEISELIQNDIKQGFTGENRVTMFDDFEKYVDAVATIPLMMLIPDEKQRRQAAREAASKAKGFLDPNTRKVYIYTQGTPAFVTIHELMHLYTSQAHLAGTEGLGAHFTEGVADYYTEIVCQRNKVAYVIRYGDELDQVKELVAVIGQEELGYLTFHGRTEGAKTIVDSKGTGTWDAYRAMIKGDDYKLAHTLLTGVKEANAARLRVEEQIRQKTEHANRAKSDAEEAKAREKWPPEGTRPIKVARVISKSIIGGKHRLTAPVGGEGGVREGWTVHVQYVDQEAASKAAKTIDTRVVVVKDRTSMFDVPPTIEPSEIKELELRPPTK